ncbi:transcription cofactor vestigial-like protein 1 [Pangasianodon hypophthalmus]|uniref:transcription cofactor vestigial-like protein 1 n=1 Tax=Pangasianodon hypophthalmus TaxID=310915 RepID=UPI002306FA81|nr:transcription cofactor vestigial-like protein 1 [Pangasianodon hypophthalmus]
MENRREEKHTTASPRSVIVTYYEGDINTVVDEHFFRALSKNSSPKDLSIKHRERHTPHTPRSTDSLTPPSWSTSWSRTSVCAPNHTSHTAPCFSAEEAVRASSVIVSRPETPASWSLSQSYMLTSLAHQLSEAPSFHPPK